MRCFIRYKDTARDLWILINYHHNPWCFSRMLISNVHKSIIVMNSLDARVSKNVFEGVQKTRSTCFIGSKTTRLRLVVLNPVKHCCSFDIVTSEFVRILYTGHMHWVWISFIGCTEGIVNLYDSLNHDIIEQEVEEHVESLMPDSYIGIVNVPVQQQLNGSDCMWAGFCSSIRNMPCL